MIPALLALPEPQHVLSRLLAWSRLVIGLGLGTWHLVHEQREGLQDAALALCVSAMGDGAVPPDRALGA